MHSELNDKVPYKMEKRTRPYEDGGIDKSHAATAQRCPEPPEAGRGKEEFSPRASGGERKALADILIPGF